MLLTKTIGRKLKTKCRLCVILSVDSAIKLKTLTDSKIQKKQIALERGYCDAELEKQANWAIVQTIIVALKFIVVVLVWVRRICPYIFELKPFSPVHVFHFLQIALSSNALFLEDVFIIYTQKWLSTLRRYCTC
jgi:hypothetical protein